MREGCVPQTPTLRDRAAELAWERAEQGVARELWCLAAPRQGKHVLGEEEEEERPWCQTHTARAQCLLPPLLLAFWHRGLGRCTCTGWVTAGLMVLITARRVSRARGAWIWEGKGGVGRGCGSLSPASSSVSFGRVPALKGESRTHAVRVPPRGCG